MEGVKRNPGVRPEYKIDESGVMVCYKACKKYMELLKNNNGQNVPVNVPTNFIKGLSKTEEKVLGEIIKNKNITRENIATELSLSVKTIARAIKVLKEKKIINRIGSDKNGHWKVTKN